MSVKSGSIRFNTDSSKLEIYNGEAWWNIDTTSPYEQLGGARGLLLGGYEQPEGGVVNTIQYINISSTGDAQDFGDLAAIGYGNASFSNRTRGIYLDNNPANQYINLSSTGNSVSLGDAQDANGEWGRGAAANDIRGLYQYDSGSVNTMEYFTISSDAKGQDFGDAMSTYTGKGCCGASPTRYLMGGGAGSPWASAQYNAIEYVTFQTLGNTADFGDTTQARSNSSSTSSPTRGIFAGGYTPTNVNTIDYVTIATTGNGFDFGDMTYSSQMSSGSGSSTRGLFWGNVNSPYKTIDYITIATTGNAVEFGQSNTVTGYANSCSSTIRSVAGGGQSPASTNCIDYITIATQGDAVDFGDLTTDEHKSCGCYSNGHGGL